ncbi:MAG: peptide chain release factor N(5)-glutamine methyltransferase [Anaerolineales bacterium]
MSALETLTARLRPLTPTPRLDASVLLAHLLNRTRTWVLAHPETQLTPAQTAALQLALSQLERGVPLPYVLGKWQFYGRTFNISPHVLIPRPETELLVEHALHFLARHPHATRAADVGSGSGCIAISLACELPHLRITAVDISRPALEILRQNAHTHGVSTRIHPLQGDLLTSLCANAFNLICANLPYIPTKTLQNLEIYEKEPALALDGGADGLHLIRRLIADSARLLAHGGLLLLEIEATQGDSVPRLAHQHFPHAQVTLHPDLAGKPRLVSIQT